MARGAAVQNLMLGREPQGSPGTATTSALKRINALQMTHQSAVDSQAIRGQGIKTPTGVDVQKESSTFNVSGVNCFNALGAVLDSALCLPIITTPEAGATRRFYSPAPRAEDTRATYTAIWGDPTEQIQALYALFNSWTLGIKRGGLEFGTSMIAQKETYNVSPTLGSEKQTLTVTGGPTGGAWTFTFDGRTVTGLAYNIAAAALQTALDTAYGTGHFVVTGGPFPATPIVVDFRGRYAFFDYGLITVGHTFTGGSSPNIAAAETIKGASEIATQAIPTNAFDIYADDTWATLGNTKLRAAYEGQIALADKFVPDWTINSANTSYDGVVEAENQDRNGRLVLGFDAVARGLISTFQARARKFIRFVVLGPNIPGTATPYKLQVDFAIQILRPTDTGSTDSVVTKSFEVVNSYDPTSGKFIEVELTNAVASY